MGDPKLCPACHAPHFNDYDLCAYCTEVRRVELERRLREDDGAASLMSIAARAVHRRGSRGFRPAWRVG